MFADQYSPPNRRLAAPVSLLLVMFVALSSILWLGVEVAQAQASETYRVQRGDNLTSIAAKYGLSVQVIASANGIVNVNNIFAGQVLKIPVAGSSTAPATTGEQGYLVQRGDTLTGLAARFGVTLYDLASLNGLSVMSYLYIGQTLRIPSKAAALPVQTTAAATTAAALTTAAPPVLAPTATPVTATATPVPATATPLPPAPTLAPVPTTAAVTAEGGVYTVQSGDTLSQIAAMFNTSVDALQQANNLINPNNIFPGQKLIIPGTSGLLNAPVRPTTAAVQPPAPVASNPVTTGKWIDVNLSQQKLVAYEGSRPVFSSLVSTGTSRYPTLTGTFNIYIKYGSQAMTGGTGRDYYYLPGVPYVMYFYGAYAIHGTYWHNNFGRPMSHGCVNLPTPAAQFMYNWAPMGTPVNIHY